MASPSVQRVHRAPCPGCGAPVEFRSAHSTHAVCTFCHSTVVRDGETLARIGKMAELFDDHSPLQLLAQGKWNNRHFTLVGRLQYRSTSGNWTEWHAVFDNGSSGWIAEDNGAYVFAEQARSGKPVPEAAQFRVGGTTAINGKQYTVAFNEQVSLVSAEGELPKQPLLNQSFSMVELRSADNEVLSVDYGATPPVLSRGRPVLLEELSLTGLREENVKDTQARQFACPSCGAQVEVQLAGTKSVTCRSCNSLIDLTSGIGGELRHAAQSEPVQPLIPLGTTGQLQGVHWQVVGYQHRVGTEPDDPDEHFGWDEYLLYNRKRGFCFLVDASDGWSIVKPATGAPTLAQNQLTASYLGTTYEQLWAYKAQTNYVAGEFYWPVERGTTTFNRDYAKGKALLSMEETPRERTWSVGHKVESDTVAKAFGIEDKKELLARGGDAGPVTAKGSGAGCGCAMVFLIVLLILVLLVVLKACDDDNWRSSGSSGRSGGSWSSGGSHK
jgi:hypothetical protein